MGSSYVVVIGDEYFVEQQSKQTALFVPVSRSVIMTDRHGMSSVTMLLMNV